MRITIWGFAENAYEKNLSNLSFSPIFCFSILPLTMVGNVASFLNYICKIINSFLFYTISNTQIVYLATNFVLMFPCECVPDFVREKKHGQL